MVFPIKAILLEFYLRKLGVRIELSFKIKGEFEGIFYLFLTLWKKIVCFFSPKFEEGKLNSQYNLCVFLAVG